MKKPFPRRAGSHQLEELSERFFRNSLPKGWTADRPSTDYGVDLRLDLFEDDLATGLELLVQLKACAVAKTGVTETVQLKVATYNFLWEKLQVGMLVKYVEEMDEAYWLLLRDVPSPPQDQETFTVHIPKDNRLSAIDWKAIQDYVRSVTDTKIAAMRRHAMSSAGNAA